MQISNLSTNVLRQVIKLREKRDSLLRQASSIDGKIQIMLGGGSVSAASTRRPGPGRKRTAGRAGKDVAARPAAANAKPRRPRRGRTGRKIVKALVAAGSKGLTVKELSEALKLKTQNLYVWFNTTGRKSAEIRKIGPAKYAYIPKA